MKRNLGLEVELVKGSGGAFEVELDGETIFSKRQLGRFPAPGEMESVIATRSGSSS